MVSGSSKRERLDTLLVEMGLCESREKAKRAIMAGIVLVDGQALTKPGDLVKRECTITLKEPALKYVSRGGLKLEKAISTFHLDLQGLVAADVGASTGGFTDCMLQNGVVRVYAVDVGYGQLAWTLRNDPRVVNLERTNIRYLTDEQIPEQVDLVTVDTAFISVTKFSGVLHRLLKPTGQLVLLIKPQFEAGPEKVGKKGVVRDPKVHEEVIERVLQHFTRVGFVLSGLTYSPIKGPEGNIEFLALMAVGGGVGTEDCPDLKVLAQNIVRDVGADQSV